MTYDGEPEAKSSRRGFLAGSSAVGIIGLLSGCSSMTQLTSGNQASETDSETVDGFEKFGNRWVTFGEESDWGLRYNSSTNELEVVHKPFGANPRRNIRIEADENGDKGDVYVDDSLIVKNEVEVSDGTVQDPSYNFVNQNDTGLWREDGGILGVSTAGEPTALFDNGTTRVEGDVTTTGEVPQTVWDGASGHAPNLPATTATASGDGSKTTFSLSHPLDTAPRVATVTPSSADAAGTFWVSDKTDAAVEVTYGSPPPSGSENLTFDLVVSL
ncbi:hypothetical protein SAMN04488063_2799 [Halopelagius inordinatus]|uniref:Uncharacterized protein n=1 Tax=Halopelagius inordinatus TaxID=553467 RepID=A0A1I2U6B9_9EURY|nr:hypothetical protein [Halopelagius inordinatus]SFG72670.1 hypothetical protein SAMN04488063_2799 [Halopelagius inordinatus]